MHSTWPFTHLAIGFDAKLREGSDALLEEFDICGANQSEVMFYNQLQVCEKVGWA